MLQTQKSTTAFMLETMLLLCLLYAGWWYYSTNLTHDHPSIATASKNPIVVTGGQHSVLDRPSLSADQVNSILCKYGSPACNTGGTFYQQSLQTGINDSFALAFFWHESNFGTQGVARNSKSIGNLRCIPTAYCVGGYAYFDSWEHGVTAWYTLIRNLYIDTWHLVTVEQIIPTYAPPSDNNNDRAYISSVLETVVSYERSGGQ